MRSKSKLLIIAALALVVLSIVFTFQQPVTRGVYNPFQRNYNSESSKVFNMLNEKGEVIHRTGLTIYVGDEFIAQDNKRYKVIKVKGNNAYAKFIKVEDMSLPPEGKKTSVSGETPTATASKGQKIAIYHTHSDESYVPSDGSSSIAGKGGIFKVGNALADRLKKYGFTVEHSLRPHDPHDANAYARSRRTAFDLLKTRPTAILDIHRDATPPEVYRRTIAGQDATGVKLVVGRQNPKMSANLAFAKMVKAVADKTHPGLVTGIFMARGDYNQDLGNRALLVEIGSHTNKREEAEKGAALFGDVMPEALKGSGMMAQAGPVNFTPNTTEIGGVYRAIFWVLGLAIVGGALFLWIATGSIKGAMDKLRHFKNVEFTNYFGPRPKNETKSKVDTEKDNNKE